MKAQKRRRGRGEGSIEQLPSGKFRAVISSTDPLTGKRVKVARTFDTHAEAVTFKNGFLERQKNRASGKRTVGEWMQEWLAMKEGKVGPTTWRWYEQKNRVYITPIIGNVPLGDLDPLLCERFVCEMRGRGVGTASQRGAVAALGAAMKDAVRYRLVESNPVGAMRKPKHKAKETKWWTKDEARRFLDHPAVRGHRLYALLRLALDSGMRQGELLALTWADIEWEAGTVWVRRSLEEGGEERRTKETKTRKGNRKIVVGRATMEALEEHRRTMNAEGRDTKTGTVFVNNNGRWYARVPFWKACKRLMRAAGVPEIRPYALRHSCASILLGAGASIRAIADRLGHEDVALTLHHYAHCMPHDQAALAKLCDEVFVSPTVVPRTLETNGTEKGLMVAKS
jgi:integrase